MDYGSAGQPNSKQNQLLGIDSRGGFRLCDKKGFLVFFLYLFLLFFIKYTRASRLSFLCKTLSFFKDQIWSLNSIKMLVAHNNIFIFIKDLLSLTKRIFLRIVQPEWFCNYTMGKLCFWSSTVESLLINKCTREVIVLVEWL